MDILIKSMFHHLHLLMMNLSILLIQQHIENPVAKLILEGRFGPKDIIPVDVDKQGHFSFNRVVH